MKEADPTTFPEQKKVQLLGTTVLHLEYITGSAANCLMYDFYFHSLYSVFASVSCTLPNNKGLTFCGMQTREHRSLSSSPTVHPTGALVFPFLLPARVLNEKQIIIWNDKKQFATIAERTVLLSNSSKSQPNKWLLAPYPKKDNLVEREREWIQGR